MNPALPRLTKGLVVALAGAATLVLASAVTAAILRPPSFTLALALVAAAYLVGFYLLERFAVTFRWREHRITTSLGELPTYVALVLLPAPLIVPLAAVVRVAAHYSTKRAGVKGVFNVATGVMASGAAVAIFDLALAAGAPRALAAVPGALAFLLVHEGLLTALFATIERTSVARVYRERFALPTLLGAAYGIPVGVALVGLLAVSPFALLAAVPLAWITLQHADLRARSDRELDVRRSLAGMARELAGATDADLVASRAVAATGDLLSASRSRLALDDGRAWERSFEGESPEGRGIAANLLDRDGARIGTLHAWPRTGKPRYSAQDEALLSLVASQAATALDAVQSYARASAQRDLLARQEKLATMGTLLAGVAHEIDNPLTYMKLRVDLAARETQAVLASGAPSAYAEKIARNLDPIRGGLDRLETLCEGLKASARPGDGVRRPTSVNEVVSSVLTVVRAGHNDVAFDVALDETLPLVTANASELHQVVLNLAKNAVESVTGRAGARVRVSTRRAGDQVLLEVEDNGEGVPPRVREKLFTPFFTTKPDGTGIGLSISREIVAAHGGSLTLAPGIPGEGARFVVTLPVRAA